MDRRFIGGHSLAGALALGVALLCASHGASAAVVTYNFNTEFSTGTPPAGPAPWLTAVFTDVSANTVSLVVSTNGLTAMETVESLYFNLDPALNATSLTFVRSNASTGPTSANTTISLGTDAYKADGDGFYDILIDLPPPPGSQAARFEANETLIYTITGAGITAASFYFLSAPAGGHGPYYAAAHVQQIGPSEAGSGWVAPVAAVPLPGALALLLSGLGLLPAARRRARQDKSPAA